MDVEMRSRDVELTRTFCTQVKRRFDLTLARFHPYIGRVTVRLSNANGANGDMDKRCQITVDLNGLGQVIVEDTNADLDTAVSCAMHSARGAVERTVGRIDWESPSN